MTRKNFFSLSLSLLLVISLILAYRQAVAMVPLPVGEDLLSTAFGEMYAQINEVMPKPGAGESAWVEISIRQNANLNFLPLISRSGLGINLVAPILQTIPGTLDLNGWQVSNESGQNYTLPSNLPLLPRNTFVLIYFDGSGPTGNDLDAADGKIVLHTPPGLLDIFPDAAGQAALYRPGALAPGTIVDFVAWGGYSENEAANAVAAGLWGAGEAVSFENGFGDISEEDLLEPNESLGRAPGGGWSNYPPAFLTPGAANPIQPVLFITPESGARVDAATLSLSWRRAAGATQYHFQLDENADFSSPRIDTFTTNTYYKPSPALPPGTYTWRVNALRGAQSTGWTTGFTIMVVNLGPTTLLNGNQPLAVTAEKVLGIARVRQNKDSRLLGLDGAPEGDATTDLPENAWDAPAPCTQPPCTDYTKYMHGNMYCVRASVRMVASYYNINVSDVLTMDRISYYVLQEWAGNTHPGTNDSIPGNDLGYDRGMYYPDEEDEAFSWALNFSYTTPGGKPSFADIKSAIDDDRPIMFRRPGHMMVIDGYRETDTGEQYVHVLDPDQPPDLERWQDYDTQIIDGYWIGPSGGAASGLSRHDEASVSTDSDGDGIMNFDESLRFGLDPYDVDSDGDWVNDKQDMREYVFTSTGSHSLRDSDRDGDFLQKELDLDNDGDGTPDGCEDVNRNGIYELAASETDNFNDASSQPCQPLFDILYPLKVEPENAGDYASPQKILVQVKTAVPSGWTLSLSAADFSVTIGGLSASVLAVYPVADTTFLVVEAPSQPSAAYYDLQVGLTGAGTDMESDAVYYLPKNPEDEVIVLDRSGSMISDDKIGAAKVAASAFVDFLADNDWIGVASFASSASSDYSLHQITAGSTVREDAISAILGLTASGSTALGQGAQQGFNLLSAAGNTDHDWSMVLLSDGWENVPPNWATVEPGITQTVVHTVALGADADTSLLQDIAAQMHGNYFYVDVEPPPTPILLGNSIQAVPLGVANALPNRLTDAYLTIAELNSGRQRLFERTSLTTLEQITLEVPKGLSAAIFSLNWSTSAGQLEIAEMLGPDGKAIVPDAIYTSKTNQQWHVSTPPAGQWQVSIRTLKWADGMELFFTLSGKSLTSLIAAVGGDPQALAVGDSVRLYGILTDHKPIAQASVSALITGQGLNTTLQLYDDGKHGDGQGGDGLYANNLENVFTPGGYSVKVVAVGENNDNETFVRYANTGFNLRPRLAYIWEDNLDTALEYEQLLFGNHWAVDLIHTSQVAATELQPYNLFIIGPDTGTRSDWGPAEAFSAIVQTEKPVLGLGEGGYGFFGRLKLSIGYPNGANIQGISITAADTADIIWNSPYLLPVTKEPFQIYEKNSSGVGIFQPSEPAHIFAYHSINLNYVDLVSEAGRYMLWSFTEGPNKMTDNGRRLFINTVYRTIP